MKINITGDFVIAPKIFDEIKDIRVGDELMEVFKNANYNIVNLEAPIINQLTPAEKYGPCLHMDDQVIDTLKMMHVNLLSLANNHILDHGAEGLVSTISIISQNNMDFFGAGKNYADASKPYIIHDKDVRVGILNFAENEFSNTYGIESGAAPLDIIQNTLSLQKLKTEVDKVIVIVHGGAELHKYPSPRFKNTLEYFAAQGADAVIAHHTHCFNGYKVINGVPIIYGTGNFLFPKNHSNEEWDTGVVVNLVIYKDKPIDFELVPVSFVYNDKLSLNILEADKLNAFNERKKILEDVISCPEKLENEYALFVEKNRNQYNHYLQPYTSKYLHKLYSLGILPDFLKNKTKRLLYLNLIRCEAHRDVLLHMLSK